MVETEETVREVAELAPGLVVVDEAYGQFAPWSALELVDDDAPLVVTRTYSKTWSMAAARLGYLVGPRWLVDELSEVVLPYHLDAVKQVAGRIALRFEDDMRRRVADLVEERGRVGARAVRAARHRLALGVELHPVPARDRRRRRGLAAASSTHPCWCATAPPGPASTAASGSRSARPAENDRFLSALGDVLAA